MTDIKFLGQTKNGVKSVRVLDTNGTEVKFVEGYTLDDIAMKKYTGDAVMPTATQIKSYAFNGTQITSLSAPNVTTIAASSIYGNTSLTSVYLRKLTTADNYALARNTSTSFTGINLPSMTGTGTYLVERVRAALDFTALSNIVNNAFRSWYGNLLVLRKSSAIVTLANIGAFAGTPFASGGAGGTIYIPKALYDHLGDGTELDYQSATNWATIHGYGTITWAKIEGSQYETHYADGTAIPTT